MSRPDRQPANLRHYLQILWRRKWIIVETAIVIPLIVVLLSLNQPKRYEATARVMAVTQETVVNAAAGTNLDLPTIDERGLQTLATFVVTPEVVDGALSELGWDTTTADAIAVVTAEADPTADVILITANDADPERAAALANAVAVQFVDWRRQSQRGSIDEAIQLVEQQLKGTPRDTLTYSALLDRRSQLEVIKALVTGDVAVGEAAQVPGTPSSPQPLRNGVLAFAAAFILGIGLAFVRESLDVKVHTVDDIADALDVPLLGTVSQFKSDERGPGRMVALEDPRSPAAEMYRFLRTNLEFVNFDRQAKTVLVTSPQPSQGKSTTIANLAVTLLRAGKKVALVEGDLRRPSLHRFFKVRNALGVTTVVSGATSLDEAVHTLTFTEASYAANGAEGGGDATPSATGAAVESASGELHLDVLTSGPVPPNPGEIVTSDQLSSILAELRRYHDYVLVDAPPMFVVGDAATLAGRVDGVIVILRFNETTTGTLAAVDEFVKRIPARTLGVVVTGVPQRAHGRSYHYDAYYE
jgi:succinoglycan biosynthesis transport protein ExoP